MTKENTLFKSIINSIMCNGELIFKEFSKSHGFTESEFKTLIQFGLSRLSDYEADELVKVDSEGLVITSKGWLVVRSIAMLFDPMLKKETNRYSQIV